MKKCFRESGQVLIVGVVMMALLLLVLLYAFDVHNVIRGKMKMEIAQEAAALAGAKWQMESLNLIGEINLVKAMNLLMEGEKNWQTALPDKEKKPEEWQKEMQGRIDLLTEMQTRISFIGPLIGFAASQQAAKANGLAGGSAPLSLYLELLDTDKRYLESYGGAREVYNNYFWREPYMNLLKTINVSKCAVYPNARVPGVPKTEPSLLANEGFYDEVMQCARDVASADPPTAHHWTLLISFLKTHDDSFFKGKWWNIDYQQCKFPEESEIFTLGVEFDSGEEVYSMENYKLLKNQYSDSQFYIPGMLPGDMKWCRYDDWWYPDYYRNNHADYDENHYKYWFEGEALRGDAKQQYRYEGPAAYTEGRVEIGSVVSYRPLKSIKGESILLKKRRGNSVLGSRRGRDESEQSVTITDYRPGAIAKVLGELKDEQPPIKVPLILPVFSKVTMMPTYMPIPYDFQVLKNSYSPLERFLSWLSEQSDLNGTPPSGTDRYLKALLLLVEGLQGRALGNTAGVGITPSGSVCGRALRYYCWNPKFNTSFWNSWKNHLYDWYSERTKYAFSQTNLSGPGWAQEPKLFSDSDRAIQCNLCYMKPSRSSDGTVTYECTKKEEFNCFIYNRSKNELIPASGAFSQIAKLYSVTGGNERFEYCGAVSMLDCVTPEGDGSCHCSKIEHRKIAKTEHAVQVPDNINGGTATRIYITVGGHSYYVIDSKGNIVTNGDPDPTLNYNNYYTGGKGGSYVYWNGAAGGYDGAKGPKRL